jgi:hypothetical protein
VGGKWGGGGRGGGGGDERKVPQRGKVRTSTASQGAGSREGAPQRCERLALALGRRRGVRSGGDGCGGGAAGLSGLVSEALVTQLVQQRHDPRRRPAIRRRGAARSDGGRSDGAARRGAKAGGKPAGRVDKPSGGQGNERRGGSAALGRRSACGEPRLRVGGEGFRVSSSQVGAHEGLA